MFALRPAFITALLSTMLTCCNGVQNKGPQPYFIGIASPHLAYNLEQRLLDEVLNRGNYSFGFDSIYDMPAWRHLSIFNGKGSNRFSNGNPNTYKSGPVPSNNASPILRGSNTLNGLLTLSSNEMCTGSNQQSGVCLLSSACNILGGQANGPCKLGNVCCTRTITSCSGVTTLNNTYFESPTNQPPAMSPCSLTVKVDKRLPEQKQAICQLRLDFIKFSIAQPAPGDPAALTQATQCLTDKFQVDGASNSVPFICGDNDGQHMYLHVPPSDEKSSDVTLTFSFSSLILGRSWRIKIALLPCSVSAILAPPDCLQYFTSISGKVSSFNWADMALAGNDVRQLANQEYKICFRTEILTNKKRAKKICFSECSVSNGGDAFLISGKSTDTAAVDDSCSKEFLFIPNGIDLYGITSVDAICGNYIGVAGTETSSLTLCSEAQPFGVHYATDDSEVDGEANNSGFCVTFKQH